MIFWQNLIGLARQRNVGATAVAVAIALAGLIFLLTPVRYTSSAILVLTSSSTSQQSTGGDLNSRPLINPLLNFNEGLNTALAILVQAMNTEEMLDEIGAGGGTTVVITDIGSAEFLGNKGPFLFITGQSTTTPEDARDIVVRAEQRARQELIARQESLNAPESQLITTLYVVEPTLPIGSGAVRFQYAGLAFGLGLVLVIGGAYLLEIVRFRRREIDPAAPDTADSPVVPPAVAPPMPVEADNPVTAPPESLGAANGHRSPVAASTSSATSVDSPTIRPVPLEKQSTDNGRPRRGTHPKPRPSPHRRSDPGATQRARETPHPLAASPGPEPVDHPTPTEHAHNNGTLRPHSDASTTVG